MNKERKAKKAIELGKYYTKKREYKKGLIYFLKGVSIFYTKASKNGDNYISIAILYRKIGEIEKAEKYMEKSKSIYRYKSSNTKGLWKIEENNGDDTLNKIKEEGYKFLEKNKYKQALHKFLSVLEIAQGPTFRENVNELLYHDIAYCYENIGDFENAEKYINKSLQISPGYLNGKIFLGNLLVHIGKKQEGEKILAECKKIEEETINMSLDLDAFYSKK